MGNFFFSMIGRCVLAVALMISSVGPYAQASGTVPAWMPEPGVMIAATPAFAPLTLKGMTVDPADPLRFSFTFDTGNGPGDDEFVRRGSERIIKYFLAGLTIPEEKIWVNLSPYEGDRLIDRDLGDTVLGNDLLAQDYILKQLSSSLMYPEGETGKAFWSRLYQKAQERFGTTDIPVNTFHKIWIVPETAVVAEHQNHALIVETRLKVLSEKDYLAAKKGGAEGASQEEAGSQAEAITQEALLATLIPEIEREVNEGAHFSVLRQIYQAVILASWYKQRARQSALGQAYADQGKTTGIDPSDKEMNSKIYDQYVAAYKKGVFDYIKEETTEQGAVPRHYFAGGCTMQNLGKIASVFSLAALLAAGGQAAEDVSRFVGEGREVQWEARAESSADAGSNTIWSLDGVQKMARVREFPGDIAWDSVAGLSKRADYDTYSGPGKTGEVRGWISLAEYKHWEDVFKNSSSTAERLQAVMNTQESQDKNSFLEKVIGDPAEPVNFRLVASWLLTYYSADKKIFLKGLIEDPSQPEEYRRLARKVLDFNDKYELEHRKDVAVILGNKGTHDVLDRPLLNILVRVLKKEQAGQEAAPPRETMDGLMFNLQMSSDLEEQWKIVGQIREIVSDPREERDVLLKIVRWADEKDGFVRLSERIVMIVFIPRIGPGLENPVFKNSPAVLKAIADCSRTPAKVREQVEEMQRSRVHRQMTQGGLGVAVLLAIAAAVHWARRSVSGQGEAAQKQLGGVDLAGVSRRLWVQADPETAMFSWEDLSRPGFQAAGVYPVITAIRTTDKALSILGPAH